MKAKGMKAPKAQLVLVLLFPFLVFAQGQEERKSERDSLKMAFREASENGERVKILERMLRSVPSHHPDSLERYAKKGVELARGIGDSTSIPFFRLKLARAEMDRANLSKALSIYLEVARTAEQRVDSNLMARAYTGAGNALNKHAKPERARHYHEKALRIQKAKKDSVGISSASNNLGISLMRMGKHDTGMSMWKQARDIKLAIGDSLGATNTMINMAKHYRHLKKYEKAKRIVKRAVKIHSGYGDLQGLSLDHAILSRTLRNQGRYDEAIRHGKKALKFGKEIDAKGRIAGAYRKLFRASAQKGDYENAYRYHRSYKKTQDKIRAEQKQKALEEIEAKYRNEKKQLRIEKQEAELAAQRREKLAFAGGLLLVLLLALLVLRNYLQKRKDNRIISEEKDKVEEQKELVQAKNEEIMDSIEYARRLQEAILPAYERFQRSLPGSFVLYEPKEAVAGDFYWLEELEDRVLFAAADCTGHGVPGAIVSVVCHNALNRSVREFGIQNPARILDKADELVMENFEASEEEVKDGMDLTLCSYEPKTGILKMAAANNPLYRVRDAQEGDEDARHCLFQDGRTLEEIKADKQAIGGRSEKPPFQEHELQLRSGEAIYIFSDGFADQFGGSKGKKFKYKPFKRFLLDIEDLSPDEQRARLTERFHEWKGELEQVDDVCVIGMKC